MEKPIQWALIYNPNAGGFSQKRLQHVLKAFAKQRIVLTPHATRAPAHASVLAAQLQSNQAYACLAAMGGDGLLNEVAQSMVGSSMPLAFIPSGTANVMAVELGLAKSVAKLAEQLVKAQPQPVFPGMLNGRYFMLMAGIGFDAAVVANTSSRIKALGGKAAYILAGVRTMLQPLGCFGITHATADLQAQPSIWLLVARARHYAGRFVLCPQAGLRKPNLAMVWAHSKRRLLWLLCASALQRVGICLSHADSLANTVEVHCQRPLAAQVDGEALPPQTHFKVCLSDKPVLLCMPEH